MAIRKLHSGMNAYEHDVNKVWEFAKHLPGVKGAGTGDYHNIYIFVDDSNPDNVKRVRHLQLTGAKNFRKR